MSQEIKYLQSTELQQVLADGFALLYHQQPKFPITYLAHYLKNYEHRKKQKNQLKNRLSHNEKILSELQQKNVQRQKQEKEQEQKKKAYTNEEEEFSAMIKATQYHEDMLDYFCDWIEKRYDLTGVYMGELKNQVKELNLSEEDGDDAHINAEAPKIIQFTHCSHSHRHIMQGKMLTQESVLGKLLSGQKVEQEGGEGEGEEKNNLPTNQIYIGSVVDAKDLHFFKYPRLGAFFGYGFKVKSYLDQKIFDGNYTKTETYLKAMEQFERELEEEENKFREAYDDKANSGAEEAQLQEMEKEFQNKKAAMPKPKLDEFQSVEKSFVIGFDTLGKDKEISEQEREKLRNYVLYLKSEWESHEIEYLKSDIHRHMKLLEKIEGPQQENFVKLVEEEDRQLPSHEEVEKYKDNEMYMQLEMNTQRIEKLKEYFSDDRFSGFIEEIIEAKVLKYQDILKYWLLFSGKKKDQINIGGTNVLDLRKARKYLDKNVFLDTINTYNVRGSKPTVIVESYAKWERMLKGLEKYQQNSVATYNIGLAFVLRFLQIAGKVRLSDRTKRLEIMTNQRKQREQNIQENTRKMQEKEEKLNSLKQQAEQKEEQFDEEAWELQWNEQNQLKEIGPQIEDEIDNDLDMPYVPPPPPVEEKTQ